jgi:sugar lactone lactonase YvrE
VNERAVTTLLDGLVFPGAPRWHGGRLWFCDSHAGQVWATTQHAQQQLIGELEGGPAGVAWDAQGRLVIVTARDRVLWRLEDRRLVPIARLHPCFDHEANSLVIDPSGRAYVGSIGFDASSGGEPAPTTIVCVPPTDDPWVAADGLLFPNGTALSSDGTTLLIAETMAQRLTAFTIGPDGALTDARVWAELQPNVPSGICLDAEGAAWVADPVAKGVLRVAEGGQMTDWVPMADERAPYACAIGGSDLRTLFICSAETSDPARTATLRSGRIETLPIEVPGWEGDDAPDDDPVRPQRPGRQRPA